MQKLKFLLFPFIPVYRLAVAIRNLLFDIGLFKEKKYTFPVIGVGNLIAGGSGKTPLVEYIIRLTGNGVNTATLSRGYKRKTKGFKIADSSSTVNEIGDEPLQYFTKFEKLTVAVHENRRKGIQQLHSHAAGDHLIILDDAFQHRYVKPGLNILVTDYFYPYTRDFLLPYGFLREPISGARRADIIVITKTPKIFSPIVRKQMLNELKPMPSQKVCFAYIKYGNAVSFLESDKNIENPLENLYSIIMVTGIGNPGPFEEYLKRKCSELEKIEYPDHHYFTENDYKAIREKFVSLPTRRKMIVTTEKDAMRMKSDLAKKYLLDLPLCYVPIEFEFHNPDKEIFDSTVKKFIAKNYLPIS